MWHFPAKIEQFEMNTGKPTGTANPYVKPTGFNLLFYY